MGTSRNKAVKKPLKRPTPALLQGLGSTRVVEPGTWQRPPTPLRRARRTSALPVGCARRSGRRGRRPAARRSPPPPPHVAGGLQGGSRPPAREPVTLL